MPRTDKYLHPWREPVTPRPAATILLLRDGQTGLEVLMTRRSDNASFAPGAYVFPGGALDAADGSDQAKSLSSARATQGKEQCAFSVAAIREAFEELGVLLAYRFDGSTASQADLDTLDRSQDANFLAQLQQRGLRMAVDQTYWLCQWVTDRDLAKRFDARFFVAPMPGGQHPVADEGEQFEPVWITPKHALERHERGDFLMIFPTVRTLRRLSAFADVQSVLAACADEKPLWVSSPRGAKLRGDIERFSEHEPAYGELELVVPDGQILHALDWRHDTVVPLLRHVHRLTAPNPSYMTGPGTNTYIIGEPGNWAVIDPGPDDEQHVARIASFVGDGLKYILCTHAHLDHAPGAVILKRLTNAPILTAPAGTNSRSDWKFDPDRTLNHGDKLVLGDTTLRAIHTPGHASNHLCFLLEEDALLLSGDHINNGSTVVIDPPDGNMSDYLRALHDLLAEKIDFILPAHGYVLGPANVAIRHLIAHRLTREAKVLGAVRRAGKAGLDKLLPLVYDDVRPELHRVASRSLLAHLQKLSEDGLVTELSDQWQAA